MEPGSALPEQDCEQDGEREKQKQKKNKIKRTNKIGDAIGDRCASRRVPDDASGPHPSQEAGDPSGPQDDEALRAPYAEPLEWPGFSGLESAFEWTEAYPSGPYQEADEAEHDEVLFNAPLLQDFEMAACSACPGWSQALVPCHTPEEMQWEAEYRMAIWEPWDPVAALERAPEFVPGAGKVGEEPPRDDPEAASAMEGPTREEADVPAAASKASDQPESVKQWWQSRSSHSRWTAQEWQRWREMRERHASKAWSRYGHGYPYQAGYDWSKHLRVAEDGLLYIRLGNLGLRASAVSNFCSWFREELPRLKRERNSKLYVSTKDDVVIAHDVDISQNNLDDESLKMIFQTLKHSRVVVGVAKLYRNKLGPLSAKILSQWIRSAPWPFFELHLSHNSLNLAGAMDIVKAVADTTQRYPSPRPGSRRKSLPLWLRLEHNQILEADSFAQKADSYVAAVRPNVKGMQICWFMPTKSAGGCKSDWCANAHQGHCPVMHIPQPHGRKGPPTAQEKDAPSSAPAETAAEA